MKCPSPDKCINTTKFTEIFRSKTDNIDKLDHAHMQCDVCGYNFNQWHESPDKIKTLFGELYL